MMMSDDGERGLMKYDDDVDEDDGGESDAHRHELSRTRRIPTYILFDY